jgi:hypothetical protein
MKCSIQGDSPVTARLRPMGWARRLTAFYVALRAHESPKHGGICVAACGPQRPTATVHVTCASSAEAGVSA